MIGVGGVIVRRQHGREQVAGAVAHVAEKRLIGRFAAPIAQHGQATPIGQAEAEDVDRIGGRMFAEAAFGSTVQPAATVAAGMIDPNHAIAKMAARGWLDDIAFPEGQRRRDGAGGDQSFGRKIDRAAAFRPNSHAIVESATSVGGSGLLERNLRQPSVTKQCQAATTFVAKCRQLDTRKGADWVVETELGPGEALGMFAHLPSKFAPASKRCGD